MKKIMITGAAGLLGSVLRERLRGRYELVLVDRAAMPPAVGGETVVQCDIADGARMEQAMQGVDAVVHLAGVPTEGPWEAIRDANIEGCYQTADAARRAGVRRIVFASSNHAIGFYPRTRRLNGTEPVRPDTRYGVSKAFGEALLSYYADKFGVTAVCLRIGTARSPDEPAELRHLSTWLSWSDFTELVVCSIEASVHFEIVFGASNNDRGWWDDDAARRIGFVPKDNAEAWAARLQATPNDRDPVARELQGGIFCAWERPTRH